MRAVRGAELPPMRRAHLSTLDRAIYVSVRASVVSVVARRKSPAVLGLASPST